MPVHISIENNASYVLIEHVGTLQPEGKTLAREKANLESPTCHRALVNFRQADLSLLSLIDVDSIAACFHQISPQFNRVATVRNPGEFADFFQHALNLYQLQGVEAAMFDDLEAAKAWLLSD